MKEILAVPEEYLKEVIGIIRTGLKAKRKVTPEVRKQLEKWCKDEEQYLRRLMEE